MAAKPMIVAAEYAGKAACAEVTRKVLPAHGANHIRGVDADQRQQQQPDVCLARPHG